jgi:hypothetical protein
MNITRKEFCSGMASGTVLLLLQSCGGGGGSYSSGPVFGSGCGATGTAIAGNHASPYAHTLSVPAADLRSGTDHTYTTEGTTDHFHMVMLTGAELLSLANGATVTKALGSGGSALFPAHTHPATITCV